MVSIPLLSISADKEFTKRKKLSSFTPAGWEAFKVQGEKWTLIDFLERSDEYVCSFVNSKVKDSTFPNGTVHPKRKSAFTLRYERTLLKYGEKKKCTRSR